MSTFGKSLTVEEQDGNPSAVPVTKIKVTNGQLTNDGNGVVSLSTGGSESDPLSLHRDQTTPQTVVNGAPQFNVGIKIKENQWIYLDGL